MDLSRFECLYNEASLAEAVSQLGARIDHDYPEGELVLLVVLKGAFVFAADLVRRIQRPLFIDFVQLASYGDQTCSSGQVTWLQEPRLSLKQRHVLVVEDILDTGNTLRHLLDYIQQQQPLSLRLCCLLNKHAQRRHAITCDYTGFHLQSGFVVGYGLDYAEQFRGLGAIYALPASSVSPEGETS